MEIRWKFGGNGNVFPNVPVSDKGNIGNVGRGLPPLLTPPCLKCYSDSMLDLGITKTPEQLARGELEGTQLLPWEREIFLAWYAREGGKYRNFYFGRRVGPIMEFIMTLPEPFQRQARAVTQLRIDFDCWRGSERVVGEVTNYAGSRSFGQLLVYARYLQREESLPKEPIKLLICKVLKPAYRELYADAGIEVYEVGE